MTQKIGILGGGQLGRMLIQAAIDLDLEIHILDPSPDAPCKNIATHFTIGSLTDFDTVYQFGKSLDILSIEIENVNTMALQKLVEEGKQVYPQPKVIEVIQDKRKQKQFYRQHQIPTADFILTKNKEEVAQNTDFLPAFQKLGSGGYDGRGVQRLDGADDLEKAFDAPGLLEKLTDIDKEIAIIISRNAQGKTAVFPPVELVFDPELNLVDYLYAPAQISNEMIEKGNEIAKKVIESLDMVGILAIELFLTKDGELLVNEVAPRPHNSGHHTIEANITSQYEQHLRTLLDLPPGATTTRSFAAMVNLLGEKGYTGPAKYDGLEEVLAMQGVYIHLYGKKITNPSRKMGHITLLGDDLDDLKQKIEKVKDTLKVVSEG